MPHKTHARAAPPICMHLPAIVPPKVAIAAAHALARADYTIANRVSEDVAHVVEWALTHHQAWLAHDAMRLLQTLDTAGSALIALVVYVVLHAR